MSDEKLTREILAIAETPASVWFVELAYREGESGHAVGSVYARKSNAAVGDVPPRVLSTNDTLSALWASPSGAVWVASAHGHVATTAEVTWPPATRFSYTSRDPSTPWVVTALPPVRSTGLPPNITALWGTSDQHVLAGTYAGHIYCWDGIEWRQVHEGPGAGAIERAGEGTIKAFGGRSAEDVLAVGRSAMAWPSCSAPRSA